MNPLTEERWKLIETIFHRASTQEEPTRSGTVKSLCGDDAELHAEMQTILSSFDTLNRGDTAQPISTRTLAGARFGNYRLDRLLGHGGMSSVYLAYRDDGQFDQKVAVKLMSPHLASEFFTERFRRERQILADLEHPNTTRLIDGGVGENGDPYLVMEYIDGQPLDQYCDQHQCPVRKRIRLLLLICSAVHYAHVRQVIHRDLKPGNILVTRQGVPKLLDFGTAKLLSRESVDSSTTSRFGMMTLRYASPEQLRGDPLTPATDVYSVGIVLYELITGAWPFGDSHSILAGLDRAVNDVKPARISEVVTEAAATARSATTSQLISEVRGDLERILAKALQSKPEDRYLSVEDFAADLRMFLDGKPIAAPAQFFWWTRRPRRAVFRMMALVIFSLGLAYTMHWVLSTAPGRPASAHVPKGEAHDAVLRARYDMQQLTTDSLTRAAIEYQRAIDLDPRYAAAYLGLGNVKYNEYVARGSGHQTDEERRSAEQLYRKALELDPSLREGHAMLGELAMQYDWDWSRSEHELRLAVAGPSSATAERVYAFFLIFHGRFAEAERHLRRMMDLDPFSSATMNSLALARNLEGRFGEAREIWQRVAAQFPKMLSPQEMICLTYVESGSPDLALPLARQLEKSFPQAQLLEAMALAKAGRRDEALGRIRPFEKNYLTSGVSMQWFALVYAFLGDEPNTVKWLARSADLHEWQALNLAVHPAYASMENSAGFRALKKRMRLEH